jgi:hypothetical protein
MARKLRNIVAFAALVMFAIAAAHLDYSNLSWKVNASDYKSMITMGGTFVAMLCCNVYEARKRRTVQE